jgi:hypothetical protein
VAWPLSRPPTVSLSASATIFVDVHDVDIDLESSGIELSMVAILDSREGHHAGKYPGQVRTW